MVLIPVRIFRVLSVPLKLDWNIVSSKNRQGVTRADATGTGFNKVHAQLAVGVILDCISNGKQIQWLVLLKIAFLCYCCLKKSSWYKDYRWCNFYHYILTLQIFLTRSSMSSVYYFFYQNIFLLWSVKEACCSPGFFHCSCIHFKCVVFFLISLYHLVRVIYTTTNLSK